MVGSGTNTWGIKGFHKCWSGSLAKRKLCPGPTGVINCTPLSALSFQVSLFPRKHGYNTDYMPFVAKLLYNLAPPHLLGAVLRVTADTVSWA